MKKKDLWKDNSIQFPRFIAEAEAAGAFTYPVLSDMADSMNLTVREVTEIIDRAQAEWEKIKKKTCPIKPVVGKNKKAKYSCDKCRKPLTYLQCQTGKNVRLIICSDCKDKE